MFNPFHLARLNLNTAVALMTLAQFPEAEKAFLAAIQFHTETGAVAWRLNDIDRLAITYIGWEKYGPAIQVLQQALVELPTVADAPNYNYFIQFAASTLGGSSPKITQPVKCVVLLMNFLISTF